MKLVSLYIENFGGLSQYSLDLEAGLTVIREPNGFGKTTLAEFIRAMFYGFPRKTKTLDKSRRQKYTPWNGGKCGGNLVFETEGERYRIERTFGATPRGDTFNLIDLKSGRKSDRFSEDIGLELFQLDADSFERSTYMPQLHDNGNLATDSIRAKLGDLVEDTNDVGNFDKAMNALRAKRSSFIPYRGSGGSVAEARANVSRLQEELDRTEARRAELDTCREAIGALEMQIHQDQQAVAQLRRQITRASEGAAVAAAHRQYENLSAQQARLREELARLEEKYPGGLPEPEQIEKARQVSDRAAILAEQTVTTREDQEAAAFLEANRRRFESGIPTAEELETCRGWCNEYLTLGREAENAGLSDGEKAQYEKLLPVFESGALEEARLESSAEASRELLKKRHEWEGLALSDGEQRRLTELEGYFAPGVPGEEEIFARRQDLARIRQLREENDRLAAQPASPRKKMNPAPAVLLLLLGALGITLGVVLLVGQNFLPGGISLGAGVLALIGAVFFGVKLMVSRELSGPARAEQGDIDHDPARMAALEQTVRAFASRYTGTQPLSDALQEIARNREELLALSARRDALAKKRQALSGEIGRLEAALRRELGEGDFDQAILNRRLARERFLNLQAKLQAAEARAETLLAQSARCRDQAAEFLGRFCQDVQPEKFHSLLSELQRSSETYARSQTRVAGWKLRKDQHDRDAAACEAELAAFFTGFGLTPSEDAQHQLLQIRDDRKEQERLTVRLAQAAQEMAQFAAAHEKELSAPAEDAGLDSEALQTKERQLTAQVTALTEKLLTQRQQERNLRAQIDRLPEIRDELERWQEKQNTHRDKAQTLDETMEFLQKAKDSLAHSYLGPIQRSFAGYIDRLAGERGEKILVTYDLEVQLERMGQARELAYFSAGQADLVMLCVRLALVDALFKEEKPFVILDDPFVNLDDEHTAEALNLLQDLAKERQIVYLTCNSSRSL